ncbi:MAG: DUF4012 domain-containing protein [Candidatus Levyibacteriota bacterium]
MKPALVTEEKEESPILIVDKVGLIGKKLSEHLEKGTLVVFVSKEEPTLSKNTVHVPFAEKFPKIPDNNYSHIIVIDDNDKATREALPSFIKKAEADKSIFLFAVSLSDMDEKTISYILDSYSQARVVIYGEIFCKEPFFNTAISKLIYQAEHMGRIEVPGDGMKNIYPVLYEDVILGILEALFGTDKESKTYYLLSKKPLTLLTFAHLVQRVVPGVGIDFVKKEKETTEIKPKKGKYIFGENYDIEQRIKNLELEEWPESNLKENKAKPEVFKAKNKKSRILFSLLFSLLFLLLLPLLSTLMFSLLGAQSLDIAKKNIEKGDSKNAIVAAESASMLFKYASKTMVPLTMELKLIGQQVHAENFLLQIKKGEGVSQTAASLAKAASSFKDVYYGSSKEQGKDFNEAISNLRESIIFVQKEKAKGDDFLGVLKNSSSMISFASATIDIWPEIMGINGKKVYLMLFQNNMELRPGGGFIGSYGLVTIDKGRVVDFVIHDVYDADGQLKAKIEPPLAIRRYLKNNSLFLRDSNFSPDFTENAARAAYFLNLETDQKVNGVIGVDLFFVKSLLENIGPVEVPEYNEKVDAKNFFYLTESHVEKDFFPGSTQKKDFLRSLFNAIEKSISNKKQISYLNLSKSIFESLDQKHLLLVFDQPEVQNIFTINNWSSSLWDGRNEGPSMINDFLGISEANIGGNKANYFVKKNVSYNVSIKKDGEIVSELEIIYKNTSDGSWPGGDYKNYLTIIVPKDSKLDSIQIDDKEQTLVDAVTEPLLYEATHFIPPKGLEIEETEEKGKTKYGFFVNIPKGELKKIKISYINPKQMSFVWPDFIYSLRLYKQPGEDNNPYTFSLKYPEEFEVVDESSEFSKGSTGISSSFKLEKDLDYFVKLGKK